jgi:cyclohexa-1,5-dienecarbonyl-CoA hydratase
VSFDGSVAFITLAHPPVNVIDFAMIDEIVEGLTTVRYQQRLCAVVFQAEGRVFSAGVDVGSHLPDTVNRMIGSFHGVFEQLDDMAVPTVALVRGACLGGACELVGYLDIVLATEHASFGLPEIKLGVFPPVAAALFPQRFGYHDAMSLLLTGESVDAAAAARMGLVSKVVADENADGELDNVLDGLRDKSATALRMVKTAALRGRRATFRELVAPAEDVYLHQLMATRDSVEGLQAFLEKRRPTWQHA